MPASPKKATSKAPAKKAEHPTFNRKVKGRERLSERQERKPYHEQIVEALERPAPTGLPGIYRPRPAAPAPRLWSLK